MTQRDFERAKVRNEIQADLDSDLVFDLISGINLYTLVFQAKIEPWEGYVRRALNLILREPPG